MSSLSSLTVQASHTLASRSGPASAEQGSGTPQAALTRYKHRGLNGILSTTVLLSHSFPNVHSGQS